MRPRGGAAACVVHPTARPRGARNWAELNSARRRARLLVLLSLVNDAMRGPAYRQADFQIHRAVGSPQAGNRLPVYSGFSARAGGLCCGVVALVQTVAVADTGDCHTRPACFQRQNYGPLEGLNLRLSKQHKAGFDDLLRILKVFWAQGCRGAARTLVLVEGELAGRRVASLFCVSLRRKVEFGCRRSAHDRRPQPPQVVLRSVLVSNS